MIHHIHNPWMGKPGYCCVGCAPDNPIGLKMRFLVDDDDPEALYGECTVPEHFQGFNGVVHGGIQTTMMDEVGEWWINRHLQTAAVTSRLEARFVSELRLEHSAPVRLRATHMRTLRTFVQVHVDLHDATGTLCATADITYATMSRDAARDTLGFTRCRTEDETE